MRSRLRVGLSLAAVLLALALCFGDLEGYAGWDSTFYLAQTSSLVEDGDLDLRNDVLYSELDVGELARLLTTTGHGDQVLNTFPIGPSLVWTPAYLVARPLERAAGAGARWGSAQRAALYLYNLTLVLALGWFLCNWLRYLGLERWSALLGTTVLVVATPVFLYAFDQYTMSHLTSSLAACLFVSTVVWLSRCPEPRHAWLSGVALGVVFLCRWQDLTQGLVLVVALVELRRRRLSPRRVAALTLAFLAGVVPVAALQSHVWWREAGLLFTLPQGAGYMHWTHPQLAAFLGSGFSGLLLWSPLIVVAAAGLLLPWRCRPSRVWGWVALSVLLVDVWVAAAVDDWWGGVSYGPRRLCSLLPLVAVGVANLALSLRVRVGRLLPIAAVALLAWGFFTANLWLGGVRDLSLVLDGRPSRSAPTHRDSIGQPAPAEARALARRLPIEYRGLDLFQQGEARFERQRKVVSAAVAGVVLLLALLLLVRVRARSLGMSALVVLFGLILAAHLRLATGPERDPLERHLWASLAREWRAAGLSGTATGTFADHLDECPAEASGRSDAYLFLGALDLLGRGRVEEADRVLGPLEARGYPAVVGLTRELGPSARDGDVRLLTLRPGTIYRTEAGGGWMTVRLRPGVDLEHESLRLELGFRPGPLDRGAFPRAVLALRQSRRLRVGVSIAGADVTMLTADRAERGSSLVWSPHDAYRLVLVIGEPRDRVRLEVSSSSGDRLVLEADLQLARADALQLTLGRPRERRGETKLEGATYADLRLTAHRRLTE